MLTWGGWSQTCDLFASVPRVAEVTGGRHHSGPRLHSIGTGGSLPALREAGGRRVEEEEMESDEQGERASAKKGRRRCR